MFDVWRSLHYYKRVAFVTSVCNGRRESLHRQASARYSKYKALSPLKQVRRYVVTEYKQTPADRQLERNLLRLLNDMEKETDPLTRSRIWAKYKDQHALRSDAYVEHLEIKAGLIK